MRTRPTPRLFAAALVTAAALAGCTAAVPAGSPGGAEVPETAEGDPETGDPAGTSFSRGDSCYTAPPFTAC
jgi:hypothetical protein